MKPPRSERLEAEVADLELHLDAATAQFADPRVASWHWPGQLGGPRTREQVRELLVHHAAEQARSGYSLWWWRERSGGEIVGEVGLHATEVEGEPAVEVGWSIAADNWGRGYATEAARASIEYGFEQIGLEEIVSFALIDNAASIRVMQKTGMERVREFERQGMAHVLYSSIVSSPRRR